MKNNKKIQTTILILFLLTIIPFTTAQATFQDDVYAYYDIDDTNTYFTENKIGTSKFGDMLLDTVYKTSSGYNIKALNLSSTFGSGIIELSNKERDTYGISMMLYKTNNSESGDLFSSQSNTSRGIYFSINTTGGLEMKRVGGSTCIYRTANGVIPNDDWTHLHMSNIAIGTTIPNNNLYINNVTIAKTLISGNEVNCATCASDETCNNDRVYIGKGSNITNSTTGVLIDEILIGSLTLAENTELYNGGDVLLFNDIFALVEQVASFPTLTELGLSDFKEYNISNYFNNYDTVNIDFLDVLNSESVSMTIAKGGSDVTRFKSQYAIRLKDVNNDLIIQFYSYLTSPIEYDVTINVIGETTESVETLFRITETPTEEEFSQIATINDLGMGYNEQTNRYMKNYFSGYDAIQISFEDDIENVSVVLKTFLDGNTQTFNSSHLKVELIPVNYFLQGITSVSDIVLKITSYEDTITRNITVTAFDDDDTLSDNFTLSISEALTSPSDESKPIAISSPINRDYSCNEIEFIRYSDYFLVESYDEVRAIITYENQTFFLSDPFYNNVAIGNGLNFQLVPKTFDLGDFDITTGQGFLKISTRDNAVSGVNVVLRAINSYGFTDSESFTVSSQECGLGGGSGFNFSPTTKLMIALIVLLVLTMGGVILGYFTNQLKIMMFVTVFVVVGFAIYYSIIGWLPVWIIIMMFIIASSVVALLIKNAVTGSTE